MALYVASSFVLVLVRPEGLGGRLTLVLCAISEAWRMACVGTWSWGGRREAPYRGGRAGKRHDDEIRILTFFMR